MSKHHKINIVGFGPSDLAATLKPGWNPITGANGSGKSNVLAALLWALGGDVPVKLRHDTSEAYVDIDGVRIKTLSKPMLNITDLELALRDESPIADIILPQVKDPKRAETARIEAVLRQVNLDVDAEVIRILVDNDETAFDYLADQEPDLEQFSIVAAADKTRRRIHEIKRKWESRADEEQGRINAVRIETPENLTERTVAEAQEAYDMAVRVHDRKNGEWAQRQEREQEREKIRRTLGTRPDMAAAESDYKAKDKIRDDWNSSVEGIEAKIKSLQRQLDLDTAELKHAEETFESAESTLLATKRAVEVWDSQKETLESKISGASGEDVERAAKAVALAREELSAARTSDEYREACATVEEAAQTRELSLKRALKYEKLATSVTSRLSQLLAKAGIEKLTVEDGRLMFIGDDGELEAFTDLSFGERTDAVIDLLARQKVPHDILVLPWQFFSALQPESREEVGKRFASRGICAITEQPDDTVGLRVEHSTETETEEEKPKSSGKRAARRTEKE